MNCHGDSNENNRSHKHSNLKHMLHMALCCGLPILIILALPLIGRFSPLVANILGIIAPFICPVMMIGMMVMMMKPAKKHKCADVAVISAETTVEQEIDKIHE
jgi:hypothetical protein